MLLFRYPDDMNDTDLEQRVAAFRDLVDEVRDAALHTEVARCDIDLLAVVKASADRLRTISDVIKTDVAVRAAELRQVDVNDVVDTTLNPDGRGNPQEELVEKDRGAVLDNLPGMDEATRSGELSAQYADVVAKAVAQVGGGCACRVLPPPPRPRHDRRHPQCAGLPVVCHPPHRTAAGRSRCAAGANGSVISGGRRSSPRWRPGCGDCRAGGIR